MLMLCRRDSESVVYHIVIYMHVTASGVCLCVVCIESRIWSGKILYLLVWHSVKIPLFRTQTV